MRFRKCLSNPVLGLRREWSSLCSGRPEEVLLGWAVFPQQEQHIPPGTDREAQDFLRSSREEALPVGLAKLMGFMPGAAGGSKVTTGEEQPRDREGRCGKTRVLSDTLPHALDPAGLLSYTSQINCALL